MANETTASSADAALQEIWISEALRQLLAKRKVSKEGVVTVKMVSGKKKGDNVDFTELSGIGTTATNTDGTVTNQVLTHTQRQVALTNWRESTITIVDRADVQSVLDYDTEVPLVEAAALGQYMDDTILDDHASLTGVSAQVGNAAAPGAFNSDMALEADTGLQDQNVEAEDGQIHWILSNRAYAQLFKNEVLQSASDSGDDKSAVVTGQLRKLLGYDIIRTSRVVSTGTPSVHKNMLLHEKCIAMGISRDLQVDKFRLAKNTQYSTDVIFGEGVIRAVLGVTINTSTVA